MPELVLADCTPEPFLSYLKALGVLRLVSLQCDPAATACWNGSRFVLHSTLDREALLDFFMSSYRPTPLVAPWNAGSGFYPGDNRTGLDAILGTTSDRFSEYRSAIQQIFEFPELPKAGEFTLAAILEKAAVEAKKDKDKAEVEAARAALAAIDDAAPGSVWDATFDEFKGWPAYAGECKKRLDKVVTRVKKKLGGGTKEQLALACRNRLSDSAVEWVDAALVIKASDELDYPPVLATGGNEGRLDYTVAFMARLKQLLIDNSVSARDLLGGALFGDRVEGLLTETAGQFDPGRAGGSNQGEGVDAPSLANPWNWVLGMEGIVVWAAGVSRRHRVNAPRLAMSPFTVIASKAGYGSSADADDARAEIWAPLWDKPAAFPELQSLFREGRADLRSGPARTGLQFAEAVAGLGVDRGVSAFVRYGVLKRRGDSYVALPAGIFPVRYRTGADLVEDFTPLLDDLSGKDVTNRQSSFRRRLEDALFAFLLRGGPSERSSVLLAFGRLLKELRFSCRKPRLNPAWLSGLSGPEFELACSLASLFSIRANLDPSIDNGHACAWQGPNLEERMAAVAARRLLDSDRERLRHPPFIASYRPSWSAIVAFLEGSVDESLLEDYLHAFVCLDGPAQSTRAPDSGRVEDVPSAWALLKLLFPSEPPRKEHQTKAEPAVISLLRAGKVVAATEIAKRRLRVSGLAPHDVTFQSQIPGKRLAASLLLPAPAMIDLLRVSCSMPTKENQ